LNNTVDALFCFFTGERFPTEQQKWVGELNSEILKADDKRRQLFSNYTLVSGFSVYLIIVG
jgi:hypothetical protein